ncbi:MAG: helix-turn-helix domain-containing protein [Rhodospirillaceae bacterium]|nr:helix-turn-helix domain-containing protein [Rhodospirillaceae bacterium]
MQQRIDPQKPDRKVSSDKKFVVPQGMEPIMVSVNAGCALLGIRPTKMYEMLNAGVIKSKKIGGKRLLDYQSLKSAAA